MSTTSAPVIVLASGSPRRRELLDLIGLRHRVQVSDVDEHPEPGESAVTYARRAASDKAQSVNGNGLPVLGSDTVVEIDGRILGKPSSEDDAMAMLASLSGTAHHVHTAVALVVNDRCETLVDSTEVEFHPVSEATARWYVDTGEPSDKAGAYAIQGAGGLLVKGINGSPHTVIGLPIHRLPELFSRFDIDLWKLLSQR